MRDETVDGDASRRRLPPIVDPTRDDEGRATRSSRAVRRRLDRRSVGVVRERTNELRINLISDSFIHSFVA